VDDSFRLKSGGFRDRGRPVALPLALREPTLPGLLQNRRIYWPRGRKGGGALVGFLASTAMLYVARQGLGTNDHWRSARHEAGANTTCLPSFRRPRTRRGPTSFHGTGGPLTSADQAIR